MNRILLASALSLAAAAAQAQPAPQQTQPAPQQAQPAPQQTQPQQPAAIPDAPRPQLNAVGPITPGKGTTSTSSGVPETPDPDQDPVGTTLPASKPVPTEDSALPFEDPGKTPELAAADLPTLSLNSRFVDVPFTVKDSRGNLVPGLTWRDIRVYENDVRQHIAVWTVDPFPLSVALVIDHTLTFDAMTRVNNALSALQGAFAPYDSVAVFTYSNQVRKETDFTGGNSPRLEAVVEQSKAVGREAHFSTGGPLGRGIDINGGADDNKTPLTAGGPGSPQGVGQVQRDGHPLNDAILEAAKSLREAEPGRRRIIYVISDGKEYGSKAKTKDVIKYLQTNKIAVYATLVGDAAIPDTGFIDRLHIPLFAQDNILPRYTAATGGQTYAEFRSPGIAKSFAKITEQVRTQYTVGYYSREPALDGKYRKLDVRVLKPNLNVIAKSGYYPQAAPIRSRANAGQPSTPQTTPAPAKPANTTPPANP